MAQIQLPDGSVRQQPMGLPLPLPDGSDLLMGRVTYNADGLASIHNADFIQDPAFAEAYRLGMSTGHQFGADRHVEWRVHVCLWAAHHASRLSGDFVECGVNTGIFSRAIVHALDFGRQTDRAFYLLDTYQGIDPAVLTDVERASGEFRDINQHYPDCYELVKRTFADFPNVHIVQGTVPGTLSQVPSERVAYLSIDMNCVVPEIEAIRFFWDKLVPGAIVVLDDYAYAGHSRQKAAFDAFAREQGVMILSLPTGQGLILKS